MSKKKKYAGAVVSSHKPKSSDKATLTMPAFQHHRKVLFITLFICSFILYANTLQNGYAIDDIEVITQNNFVTKGISGIPEILSTAHLRGFIISPNETYRPLSLVFFFG